MRLLKETENRRMKETKKRILRAALELFNEKGYVNVRLFHIAEQANMSTGNMAYHFKQKEEMLSAIYGQLQIAQKQLLSDIRLTPIFENFEFFIRETFDLQQKYIFFYLDTLELMRTSEELAKSHQEHIKWQLEQLSLLIELNKARGVLQWEVDHEVMTFLPQQLWRAIDFWYTTELIVGQSIIRFENYRLNVWAVLQAYFTNQGWREYEALQMSNYMH